ncbi:MAG TPA: hypothetical protein PKC23_00345 [Candidatus Desulfobacillus sp.]|nr:hypothetical protein [Candidatus Desulfobacillus sp.]
MRGIFSAKSSHPLADAREARRILDGLAAEEPSAALDAISGWLESVVADELLRLPDCLGLVLRLDEAAQPHTRRLARHYLTSPRLGRQQEYRLWKANHDFWALLASAYENCLDRFQDAEKGAASIRPQLPLFVVRLLRALATQLKWAQFRYGPIEDLLWQRMGRAYLFAEAENFSEQPLAPYAGVPGESSARLEYLKALVFQVSSMDSLMPLEIEIAERCLGHYLPLFAFGREAAAPNAWWVNAARSLPPRRLAAKPQAGPGLRFFAAGTAPAKLGQLRQQVERGEVPAEINLGAQYSPRILLPVLNHLSLYWASRPPTRSHDRHQVSSRLAAVSGLGSIHGLLTRYGGSKFEHWTVEDVSLGGMGARVAPGRDGWVRVGALLGMQPEGGDNWLVGVIRRFNRIDHGRGRVGIETLSRSPQAIAGDLGGVACQAILLDTMRSGETVRVILPNAAFEPAVPLVFPWQGRSARLDPVGQLRAGAEFDLGLYRVQPPA